MLTLIAIGAGALLGLISGPLLNWRRQAARLAVLRHWWVLAAGVVLSFVLGGVFHGAVSAGCVTAGYVALIAFCWLNRGLVGLGVIAGGLLLNALVVTANGGMPVHPAAIRATSGSAYAGAVAPAVNPIEGRHHLETGADALTLLDDRVPAPSFHQVLSVGDIVLLVGIGEMVMAVIPLSLPLGPRRRPWVHPRPLRAQRRRTDRGLSGA